MKVTQWRRAMQLTAEKRNMKILIAGAGGQVRRAFSEHFSGEHQVLPLTRRDLVITHAATVKRIILCPAPLNSKPSNF